METPELLPTWAPRVSQASIRRLYEDDARGMLDDTLLDDVGWALYHRCRSFIAANEAVAGLAPCPSCGAVITHHTQPEEVLRCPACGWQAPWKSYFLTIQRKQLSGAAPVIAFFQDFIDRFPAARDPHEKMLLIDRLIHGWHWNSRFQMNTRAACVNLIEGGYHEVVDFLDSLSYGPNSTPGVTQQWTEWRKELNQTADLWNDDRLRKPSQPDEPEP